MFYAVVIGVYTHIINILGSKINRQMKLLNYWDLVEVRPPGLAGSEERFPACANSVFLLRMRLRVSSQPGGGWFMDSVV